MTMSDVGKSTGDGTIAFSKATYESETTASGDVRDANAAVGNAFAVASDASIASIEANRASRAAARAATVAGTAVARSDVAFRSALRATNEAQNAAENAAKAAAACRPCACNCADVNCLVSGAFTGDKSAVACVMACSQQLKCSPPAATTVPAGPGNTRQTGKPDTPPSAGATTAPTTTAGSGGIAGVTPSMPLPPHAAAVGRTAAASSSPPVQEEFASDCASARAAYAAASHTYDFAARHLSTSDHVADLANRSASETDGAYAGALGALNRAAAAANAARSADEAAKRKAMFASAKALYDNIGIALAFSAEAVADRAASDAAAVEARATDKALADATIAADKARSVADNARTAAADALRRARPRGYDRASGTDRAGSGRARAGRREGRSRRGVRTQARQRRTRRHDRGRGRCACGRKVSAVRRPAQSASRRRIRSGRLSGSLQAAQPADRRHHRQAVHVHEGHTEQHASGCRSGATERAQRFPPDNQSQDLRARTQRRQSARCTRPVRALVRATSTSSHVARPCCRPRIAKIHNTRRPDRGGTAPRRTTLRQSITEFRHLRAAAAAATGGAKRHNSAIAAAPSTRGIGHAESAAQGTFRLASVASTVPSSLATPVVPASPPSATPNAPAKPPSVAPPGVPKPAGFAGTWGGTGSCGFSGFSVVDQGGTLLLGISGQRHDRSDE